MDCQRINRMCSLPRKSYTDQRLTQSHQIRSHRRIRHPRPIHGLHTPNNNQSRCAIRGCIWSAPSTLLHRKLRKQIPHFRGTRRSYLRDIKILRLSQLQNEIFQSDATFDIWLHQLLLLLECPTEPTGHKIDYRRHGALPHCFWVISSTAQ